MDKPTTVNTGPNPSRATTGEPSEPLDQRGAAPMADSLPLPKYHRVYLVLLEQLREGRFADGLPSELMLGKQFGTSRITVRHALKRLASEGLIIREAGRGTRPAPPQPAAAAGEDHVKQAHSSRLTGLLGNIVDVSLRTEVDVLEWRTIHASEAMAEVLQATPGAKLKKAVRRRSLQGTPMSYITTYVPDALVSNFGRRDLTHKPMLRLLQESGVELGRARQTISARQADAVVASALGVEIGTALLAVQRLVYDTSERPVQLLYGLYRPDLYEYRMEISQVGDVDAQILVKANLSD